MSVRYVEETLQFVICARTEREHIFTRVENLKAILKIKIKHLEIRGG